MDPAGLLVHPLLAAPPTVSLWRAPTDNDRIGGMGAQWVELGPRPAVTNPRRESIARARRSRPEHLPGAPGIIVRHEQRFSPLAGGGIRVDEEVEIPPELTDLARVGTVLETAAGLERINWFGAGPHETYPDRKRGGLLGSWQGSVTDQAVRYVRPQENGGHAEVRWLELRERPGRPAHQARNAEPGRRPRISGPPTWTRLAMTSSSRRSPRRSSTSTPPTAAWAPPAAARTHCRSTSSGRGSTAGHGRSSPGGPIERAAEAR